MHLGLPSPPHLLFALLGACLPAMPAWAATYQKIDGTIVDPIRHVAGGNLVYLGTNLEPSADLSGADLSGANLPEANLTNSNLWEANLENARLVRAFLDFAVLRYADLTHANLTEATMEYAYLNSADLSDAKLTNVHMAHANLDYAILANANLEGTHLEQADLFKATFSTNTTLYNGDTVAEHGFDALALQDYLEDTLGVARANHLTILTIPAVVPLPAAAWMAMPLLVTLTATGARRFLHSR